MLISSEATKGVRVRTVSLAGLRLHAPFLAVAVTCFVGIVVTDLCYQGSDGNLLWLNSSTWLLAAGIAFGVVAFVLMLIDAVRGLNWLAALLLFVVLVEELFNSLIHARDGWTAVVPTGFLLSIIGAVLALVTGWLARARDYPEGSRR